MLKYNDYNLKLDIEEILLELKDDNININVSLQKNNIEIDIISNDEIELKKYNDVFSRLNDVLKSNGYKFHKDSWFGNPKWGDYIECPKCDSNSIKIENMLETLYSCENCEFTETWDEFASYEFPISFSQLFSNENPKDIYLKYSK